MKQRNGFVSNSSSSSFIVAYETSLPCPHCGRSDKDFADMIRASGDIYEDTYIIRTYAGDILDNLNEQVNIYKRNVKELSKENPRNKIGTYTGSNWTVGQEIESAEEQIKIHKEAIAKVEEYMKKQWKVIEFSVSNHSSEIYEHIRNNEEKLVIILGEDR